MFQQQQVPLAVLIVSISSVCINIFLLAIFVQYFLYNNYSNVSQYSPASSVSSSAAGIIVGAVVSVIFLIIFCILIFTVPFCICCCLGVGVGAASRRSPTTRVVAHPPAYPAGGYPGQREYQQYPGYPQPNPPTQY